MIPHLLLDLPPWYGLPLPAPSLVYDADAEASAHEADAEASAHEADADAMLGGVSYTIVEGDLEPDMEIAATVNGAAEVLTGSLAFVLRWKLPDGTLTVVDCEAVDLLAGLVKRVWEAGDTDQTGRHRGQLVVTRANGEQQTFPSRRRWFSWHVTPALTADE